MLLPKTKEREYRFKLALRMGLPIFGLILALVWDTFISYYDNLDFFFFLESTLLVTLSIYFIFHLIYHGFSVKITEDVSKTFTREYLVEYLRKEIQKEKNYTLILVSIDNLQSINENYGLENGDKVLYTVAHFISDFFESNGIKNFPLGHIKGGDFILGFKGNKEQYKSLLELFCIKVSEYKVDKIEVKISSAINDTNYSNELDYLVENLFEIQTQNRFIEKEILNPSQLESSVIESLEKEDFIISTQNVYESSKSVMKECFVKLKIDENKVLFAKRYMKILKKLNLMFDFDMKILKRIVIECSKSDDEIFALSLSPTTLRDSSFVVRVKNLLTEYPNTYNRLMFIVCEDEYYSNLNSYNKTIKQLKELGIKIAVDRLGSLHTSFLYLRDLDIDVVRFDKFYTKDTKIDDYIHIINGYNSMAHSKSVKTWIKLLETKEIKDKIDKIGVDYTQGIYLSKLEQMKE